MFEGYSFPENCLVSMLVGVLHLKRIGLGLGGGGEAPPPIPSHFLAELRKSLLVNKLKLFLRL